MKILGIETSCDPAQYSSLAPTFSSGPRDVVYAGQVKQTMTILGIETSCDETAVSVVQGKTISDKQCAISILSNIVSSQVDLHKKYGGVYPELASRAHLENILPALSAALDGANCQFRDVDCLAVTTGPGLIGSLLIGVNFAKTLAYVFKKPIIGINHLEGHIYSAFSREIRNPTQSSDRSPHRMIGAQSEIRNLFPALCLVVSGGHTSLILMKDHGKYQIIGQTRDDAAGEAFDKVAALLGLPYPGGPSIEAFVSKLKTKKEKVKIELPRPMIKTKDFDFSFSGLKTAVLYTVKQLGTGRIKNVRQEIASEFQQAVVDVLISKTFQAAEKFKPKTIMLAGGVSANKELREQFKKRISLFIQSSNHPVIFHCPPMELATDNAVMVATAGFFKALKNKSSKWYDIKADANVKLTNWEKI